ncbi:hypothetical protein Tco_0071572 [Tanacetum coccineum]
MNRCCHHGPGGGNSHQAILRDFSTSFQSLQLLSVLSSTSATFLLASCFLPRLLCSARLTCIVVVYLFKHSISSASFSTDGTGKVEVGVSRCSKNLKVDSLGSTLSLKVCQNYAIINSKWVVQDALKLPIAESERDERGEKEGEKGKEEKKRK